MDESQRDLYIRGHGSVVTLWVHQQNNVCVCPHRRSSCNPLVDQTLNICSILWAYWERMFPGKHIDWVPFLAKNEFWFLRKYCIRRTRPAYVFSCFLFKAPWQKEKKYCVYIRAKWLERDIWGRIIFSINLCTVKHQTKWNCKLTCSNSANPQD